jgi:hypothetical protein
MEVPICRHIRTNGLQCRAPQLHRTPYCYFHARLHQRHAPYRNPVAGAAPAPLHLGPLEDRESIQVALSVVLNALAAHQLDRRHATALLYGLQLASNNAARLDLAPSPTQVVRSLEPAQPHPNLAPAGPTGPTPTDLTGLTPTDLTGPYPLDPAFAGLDLAHPGTVDLFEYVLDPFDEHAHDEDEEDEGEEDEDERAQQARYTAVEPTTNPSTPTQPGRILDLTANAAPHPQPSPWFCSPLPQIPLTSAPNRDTLSKFGVVTGPSGCKPADPDLKAQKALNPSEMLAGCGGLRKRSSHAGCTTVRKRPQAGQSIRKAQAASRHA